MEPNKTDLESCKRRALSLCEAGDVRGAFISMRDAGNDEAMQLGTALLMAGRLSTPSEMKTFIEGFN